MMPWGIRKNSWSLTIFFIWYKNKKNEETSYKRLLWLGEWRGLVVSAEDCHSKGRGIESRSFSFFYSFPNQSREEAFVTRRNVRVRKWPATKRDGERGSGEKKKRKNQQADQERLRELVRFVSKTIKWSTPSKEWHGEKIITCCY